MKAVLIAALVAAAGTTAFAAPTGAVKSSFTKKEQAVKIDRLALEDGYLNFAPAVLTKKDLIHPGRPVGATPRLPSSESLDRIDYTYVTGDAVGTTPSDNLFRPMMSGNGNFIVYTSLAQNLVADDTFGVAQCYRTDITTSLGTNVLVSKNPTTLEAGNGSSGMPTFFTDGSLAMDYYHNSISDDGTKICFTSNADNLQTAVTDTNDGTDVFLWNATGGTITMVSTDSTGAQMNVDFLGTAVEERFSRDGMISGDGNFVAFLSAATLPGTTDRDGIASESISLDVFRKNLNTNATQLVSHAAGSATIEGNIGDSYEPSISADGSKIVFTSRSRDLSSPAAPSAADDANFGPRTDVFLWNAATDPVGCTVMGRTNAGGSVAGAVQCFTPHISPNGQYVAWNSRKASLAGTIGAVAAGRHCYIRDVTAGDAAIRYVNTTTGAWLDPGLTRAMTPTALNNGDVIIQSYGDLFAADAAKLNNFHNVYVKTWTAAWPATGNAGTISEVSKSASGTQSNMSPGGHTNGFLSGQLNRVYANTAGTKLMFAHRATFGSFNTAGLLHAFVADVTPGASYTVTALDAYPKAITKPGITVSFAGSALQNGRNSQRVAVSPNGRYAAFGLAGGPTPLEVLQAAGPSEPRKYSGLSVGEVMRFDLNSGEMAFGSYEDIGGGTLSPLEDSAGSVALVVGEDPPGSFTNTIFPTGTSTCTKEVSVSNFGQVAFFSFSPPDQGTATFDGSSGYLYYTDPTAGTGGAVHSSLPGAPHWGTSTATGAFTNSAVCLTPDGRYIGFTTPRDNVHADTPGGSSMGYVYDTTNPTGQRLVTRRSAAGTFFAQDTPNADCVLVALSNDGQRAVFNSVTADDVFISGSPSSLSQTFLYNDLSDGTPNNGDVVGGAVIVQLSADSSGATMANTDTDALVLGTGFASVASIDGNATKYAFPGTISNTIPNTPAGLVAGVPGSQLYLKGIGPVNLTTGADSSPLTILSRKNNSAFLEPLTVDLTGIITNVSTFEEVDSATLSNDGAYMAVVTNARSDASVGFPGALGVDLNSPLVPASPTTASGYDVFVIENLTTAPTWSLVSKGAGASTAQSTFGSEAFRQVQTPTAYAPGIGVTTNGNVRVAFAFEGDNSLNPADALFGRTVYVKSYFPTPPAAVTSDWSSYQ